MHRARASSHTKQVCRRLDSYVYRLYELPMRCQRQRNLRVYVAHPNSALTITGSPRVRRPISDWVAQYRPFATGSFGSTPEVQCQAPALLLACGAARRGAGGSARAGNIRQNDSDRAEWNSRGTAIFQGIFNTHKDPDPKDAEASSKAMTALFEQEDELEKPAKSGDIDAR